MSTSSVQQNGGNVGGGGESHQHEESNADATANTSSGNRAPRHPSRSPVRPSGNQPSRSRNRNQGNSGITHSPQRIPRKDRIRPRPAARSVCSLSPTQLPRRRRDYPRACTSLRDLNNSSQEFDYLHSSEGAIDESEQKDISTSRRRNPDSKWTLPKKADRALRAPTRCITQEDNNSETSKRRTQLKSDSTSTIKTPKQQKSKPSDAVKSELVQWPRQLCRSVSVDDLMEYQRAFSLGCIGRSASSQSLFLNGRKKLNEQQNNDSANIDRNNNESKGSVSLYPDAKTLPVQRQQLQPDMIVTCSSSNHSLEEAGEIKTGRKTQRKSIANSDLEEFKRMFQMDFIQKGRKDIMLGELRRQHSNESDEQQQLATQTTNTVDDDSNLSRSPPPSPPEPRSDDLIDSPPVPLPLPAAASPSARLLRRKMINAMQSSSNTSPVANTKNVSPIPPPPAETDPNHPKYQWGTQSSVRKGILASDLTSFHKRASWKSTLDTADSLQQQPPQLESHDRVLLDDPSYADGAPKLPLASALKSSGLLSYPPLPPHSRENMVSGEWGTRSLRRFILSTDYPQYNNSLVRSFHEGDEENNWGEGSSDNSEEDGFDTELNNLDVGKTRQHEKDDLISIEPLRREHPLFSSSVDASDALKMPRRVVSAENIEHERSTKKDGPPGMPHKSGSGPPPTVFRRSISSSDLEKLQRQKNLDNSQATEPEKNKYEPPVVGENYDNGALENPPEASEIDLGSIIEGLSGVNLYDRVSDEAFHPLVRKLSSGASNDAPPRYRGHKRSNSDDPQLHMDEIAPDVAPRKPKRTSSSHLTNRNDSSSQVNNRKAVRFAVDETIIPIPRVSAESKKLLFYTKRDVRKFRMNEHKRQEEQIREYMEYLNEKQSQLQNSIFD